jgi:hypothetical protein
MFSAELGGACFSISFPKEILKFQMRRQKQLFCLKQNDLQVLHARTLPK